MRRWAVLSLLLTALGSGCLAQCIPEITPIPKPAAQTTSPSNKMLYRTDLSASIKIGIFTVASANVSQPAQTEIRITQDQKLLKVINVNRYFNLDEDDETQPLALARGCITGKPVYILSIGMCCDMTAGDLYMIFTADEHGIKISRLKPVSGGTLDISRSDASILRTWNNLFEGSSNADLTHYEIATYKVTDGNAQLAGRRKTKNRYSSGSPIFDDRLRMRFVR